MLSVTISRWCLLGGEGRVSVSAKDQRGESKHHGEEVLMLIVIIVMMMTIMLIIR